MSKPDPNCPDLDKIIQQITNNDDFRQMMESVSDELSDANVVPSAAGAAAAPTPPSSTSAGTSNAKEIEVDLQEEPMSNYDMLCTFFSDSDGNSISDTLTNIDSNLERIATSLETFVAKSD